MMYLSPFLLFVCVYLCLCTQKQDYLNLIKKAGKQKSSHWLLWNIPKGVCAHVWVCVVMSANVISNM